MGMLEQFHRTLFTCSDISFCWLHVCGVASHVRVVPPSQSVVHLGTPSQHMVPYGVRLQHHLCTKQTEVLHNHHDLGRYRCTLSLLPPTRHIQRRHSCRLWIGIWILPNTSVVSCVSNVPPVEIFESIASGGSSPQVFFRHLRHFVLLHGNHQRSRWVVHILPGIQRSRFTLPRHTNWYLLGHHHVDIGGLWRLFSTDRSWKTLCHMFHGVWSHDGVHSNLNYSCKACHSP